MTRFYKVSGSGNDFLALPEPQAPPAAGTIRAWCRRGVSLGADGLFVLRRGDGGVEMDYFNADGLPADLCMNGTRCAAQLAFHLGWAEQRVTIRTAAGAFTARRLDDTRVAVDLPAPGEPRAWQLKALGELRSGHRLTVGVPHFVLLWEDLERAPVRELGAAIRGDASFGAPGTNVNFVRFPEPGRMDIRTFERGVEDETLSCGTGVLASTAVGLATGSARLPLRAQTRGGFELEVEENPAAGTWSLGGDARVVATGELLPGALVSSGPHSCTPVAAGGQK